MRLAVFASYVTHGSFSIDLYEGKLIIEFQEGDRDNDEKYGVDLETISFNVNGLHDPADRNILHPDIIDCKIDIFLKKEAMENFVNELNSRADGCGNMFMRKLGINWQDYEK